MFDRIRTGWRLAGASWRVLKADRSLAIFPVLSAIFAVLAIALVLSPWWLGLDAGSATGGVGTTGTTEESTPVWVWALLLAAGYVATAIAIFFNVALASCAARSLDGEDTKVREGLAVASARLPKILGWALIAFFVGLVLRVLDEVADEAPFPLSLVANIGVAILGMAWSAVTFLVVPVLALEDVGPTEAFGRSKDMIVRRWGEGLAGNVGIGLAVFVFGGLPGIVLMGIGGATGGALGGALAALGMAVLVVATIIGSTLNQVFAVALYRYANGNDVAPGFTSGDMQVAFRRRARR
ncbi:MAG: conserved hypothetical rane protein [Thermoleophilia bacterium]|nr:conserved hypothetical rane protein [Thermoleophilia bacterium]